MKTTDKRNFFSIRKFSAVLLIAVTAILASCEGPVGPMGPPGEDGFSYAGSIYEVEVDFNAANEYSVVVEHPSSIEVLPEDVVLVYILWEYDGTEIWRLCPQTMVLPDGVIQYNFDYTQQDTRLFLEYTVDEASLLPAETQGQVFRIAVLPIDFVAQKSVDVNDFNSILKAPQIELKQFDTIKPENISSIK